MFNKIVNSPNKITLSDISAVLEEVGKPGQKQDEKLERIKELFDAKGESGTNFQGLAIWDTLESFPEY